MENKIIISNAKDREDVAIVLIRNGYTVRFGSVVINGKKQNVVFYKKGDL